jgi:N-acetylneuraminic acid mutarotase
MTNTIYKRIPKIICFSLICILFVFTLASAQEGQWIQLENMQTKRGPTSACAINDKLYVIGSGRKVEEYDPATNQCRVITELPVTRNGGAMSAINNLMYVTGGQTAMGQPGHTSLHCYDPSSDTWKTDLAEMPVGQYVFKAKTCGGKLYAGFAVYHPRDFAEYDPEKDKWKVIPVASQNLMDCTSFCEHDGELYFFGSVQSMKRVRSYNPATGEWQEKASLPTGRIGAAVGCINGLIYVAGGTTDTAYPFDPEKIVDVVEAYDPERDIWYTGFTPMMTPRHFSGFAVIDDLLYVTGGHSQNGNSNVIEAFNAPTAVNVNTRKNAPTSCFLHQNYPNPFNPSTTIEYELPKNSYVTLKVCDLLGREIQTLLKEHQMAGTHSVVFESENLSSGVYLYSLESENFYETRKMLLVR